MRRRPGPRHHPRGPGRGDTLADPLRQWHAGLGAGNSVLLGSGTVDDGWTPSLRSMSVPLGLKAEAPSMQPAAR